MAVLAVLAAAPLLIGSGTASRDAPAGDGPGDAILFQNVTVLAMTGEDRAVTGRSVLVRDGRIARIGPADAVAAPAGATVVEGAGRFLAPGLSDLHVHLERLPDPRLLALFLAHGVTTVRNMDGRPFVLEWRRKIEAGGLLGPRIVTAGQILEGPEPFWDDTRVVDGPEAARRAVAEQVAAGYDFVKVYHTLRPDAYRAVLDAATEAGVPVAGHAPNGVPFHELLTGGQRSIEHLDGYLDVVEADDSPFRDRWSWHKLYLAVPVDDRKIEDAARATARAGVWNVPTLTVKAKVARREVVEGWLEDPRLRYLPKDLVGVWRSETLPRLKHLDDADFAALRQGEEARESLVAALHGAGAGILAGTDTPNPFVLPGVSLHEEIERLAAAGLSPYDALAAATSGAGRFLTGGVGSPAAGQAGTITAGAPADLVLLEASPVEDIANTRRIAGVTVRGRWLPIEELQALLERLAGD
jgi:imidazolonepropionase-like amidohydrolase